MTEKVIQEIRLIETETGFRVEINGDKEQLKEMGIGKGLFGFGRMMRGGPGHRHGRKGRRHGRRHGRRRGEGREHGPRHHRGHGHPMHKMWRHRHDGPDTAEKMAAL